MAQSNTLPKRSEVDKQFTWAIEDIFATDELWEKEYNKIKELLPKAESYKGRLVESAKNLLEFLKLSDELGILMDRVYVYANQRYHEDTANSVYQDLADKAGLLLVQMESALSFATPEILTISEDTLQKYMQEEEGLRLYDFYLKNILRRKPHILNAEMEALLADAGDMASGPDNIYSKFNNADIRFPEIKDEDGNLVRITHGRFIRLMESNDRRVRQDAFKALYETYGNFKNTLAATFSSNIKQELFFTKARKYGSNLEKALDASNIPVSVYTNLIEAVHDNLGLMHRYISLRKKILGLDELHMYDIYAPLVKEINMDIPFEEAKKIVAEGLKPLGEDYQKVLQEGFNNRWIDVYENENKRSGAYSWGAYGTHPYVLLNYNGSLDNVFTLAHEMGHAIHSYYSDKTQPFVYAGYKIFVAEVASTCNEALLINHMLKTTDDKMMKAYLINHFLDTFRGTL
ncbi:MAG TPA: M3 family oligoendopeptidase, partial [Mobilitalea sp.]|nr:M3 family oligoendopeptidase [Mobilitalea sp.]